MAEIQNREGTSNAPEFLVKHNMLVKANMYVPAHEQNQVIFQSFRQQIIDFFGEQKLQSKNISFRNIHLTYCIRDGSILWQEFIVFPCTVKMSSKLRIFKAEIPGILCRERVAP